MIKTENWAKCQTLQMIAQHYIKVTLDSRRLVNDYMKQHEVHTRLHQINKLVQFNISKYQQNILQY